MKYLLEQTMFQNTNRIQNTSVHVHNKEINVQKAE